MADLELMEELASKLRAITDRGLATQVEIAARTQVDQSTVSKLMNGVRRRRSEAVDRVNEYADMLLRRSELPDGVISEANRFLVFGTEEQLIASIRLCTDLVARRTRGPQQEP